MSTLDDKLKQLEDGGWVHHANDDPVSAALWKA